MSFLDRYSDDSNTNNAKPLSFKIQFGLSHVEVTVTPGDNSIKTLDAALRVYADALGYDFNRAVVWRSGPERVPGDKEPVPGHTYVASVSHEQKG